MRVATCLALALATIHAPPAAASPGGMSFQPQVHGLACLRPRARAMVSHIVGRVGAIQVTSTCGGRHARHSKHYEGLAVDFRPLSTSPRAAASALHGLPEVGGIGTYSNGIVHADAGPERMTWHRGGTRIARRTGTRLASFSPRGRTHLRYRDY